MAATQPTVGYLNAAKIRFSPDRADKAELYYTKREELDDTLQCIIHSCSNTNFRLKIVLSQITVIDDSRSKKRCKLVEDLRETKKKIEKKK